MTKPTAVLLLLLSPLPILLGASLYAMMALYVPACSDSPQGDACRGARARAYVGLALCAGGVVMAAAGTVSLARRRRLLRNGPPRSP